MLIDTHAHIHFDQYSGRLDEVFSNAQKSGVSKIITVGVDETDSHKAVVLAERYDQVWATVGLHPHEASRGQAALDTIAGLADHQKVVAIGECGLDFFRNLSTHEDQEKTLRFQIELALKLSKPLVFHVRDAFDEFFEILDSYSDSKPRGVVHCFTSTCDNMEKAVERGLLIALNGIMTFTKDQSQLEMARSVPSGSLVLETDCPFLTPHPLRGRENEPANLKLTIEFLANLRGEDPLQLAEQTTSNAVSLFGLDK